MKKRLPKSGFFLKCLMVLLAIGWSTSSVQATVYYHLEIIPVLDDETIGKLYAFDYTSSYNAPYNTYTSNIYNIGKDNAWTICADEDTHFSKTLSKSSGSPYFYIFAQPGNHSTMFEGWYWNADCTERLGSSTFSGNVSYSKVSVSGNGRTLKAQTTKAKAEEEANVIKIYAKFVKVTPAFDWATLKKEPMDGGKYYIYSPVMHRFLKAPVGDGSKDNRPGTTNNQIEATLFTCDSITKGTKNTYYDDYGVKENRSYKACTFAYNTDGTTRYAHANDFSWGTTSREIYVWSGTSALGKDTFMLSHSDATGSDFSYILEALLDGTVDYSLQGSTKRNGGIYWTFIPEEDFNKQSAVTSLNANGSVTIDASPTATGTAYVTFNVTSTSVPAGFTYDITGGDGHFSIVEESITCVNNILTVPVTYTAQNAHSGATPIPDATLTVTAKNGLSTATGTVSAYVDLLPKFALMVNELDWSHVGEDLVETFYSGMEVAASQRDRLSNKLIYNPAQTTGVAANNATWTATIEGANANQFKFANGTREVSGAYSASLLDVIYAPTTTGEHTATLHIVTSYTDVNSHEEIYEKNITLKGTGSVASRITFAANGSDSPQTAESYKYDTIIGTNHKDVSVELFISQISSPDYNWNDPAEVFELDESTIDLTKKDQTLSFRAHPDNPVSDTTTYTATLTVSGKGTANEDVSATLTLTYVAVPLIPTTATWNWGSIQENTTTTTSPITTNSDGEWLLTKTTGDAVTYNNETKTATAAYLHHEPGKKATFYLTIPQTDTYTAYEDSLETTVFAPVPADVLINTAEKHSYISGGRWSNSYSATRDCWVNDSTLHLGSGLGSKYAIVISPLQGQTRFEFDFAYYGSVSTAANRFFTITEYDASENAHTIWGPNADPIDSTHYAFTLSPKTVKVKIETGKGRLTNIHFYEPDTITVNYSQVGLVNDGGVVNTLPLAVTMANKKQVTASLNANAAQYFEIRCTGKTTGSSIVFDESDGMGIGSKVDTVITVALKEGVTVAAAQAATAGNTCLLTLKDNYTYNSHEVTLPIVIVSPNTITYKLPEHGTYSVTYQNDGVKHDVTSADYVKPIASTDQADFVLTLSAPAPAAGFEFQGWKINGDTVSLRETFKTSIGITCDVEALFAQIEGRYYKVGNVYFDDLSKALHMADRDMEDKVVTLMQDRTLGDGHKSITYTIPAEVTLLIPHKENFYTLQTTPEIVNLVNKEVLSAYRTLTLTEGVTIICNGNICVSAKILSSNGGNKSAYPTDECGVINMANGGHIELNDGSHLYCWGYIKGQDMDQGNNTVGTGTVTANAGSTVWENFELGDWRGGSASVNIYNNNVIDHRKLFPFQSYAIQNVEIPTTFMFGSTLRTFTSITTGFGDHNAVFSMISNKNTMFLLLDEQSMVRTWYDPTSDLTCYELSGSAQLDALHVNVYVEMSSEDFILPISNSMHIILKDNLTLSNPLMQQAGSIIEIKPTATVNLESELYLYDKDQWGLYIHNYYFRSFGNLTSHKDRGAEDSKDGLDDAKLIVDGVLNVQNGGKIYTTAGGANVMGNGGGEIHFKQALPGPERLWAVRVIGELPYIKWEYNDATAANLCNEDGSYTESLQGETFHNVHGRWFGETDDEHLPQANHTYWFRYLDNGNSGEEVGTAAVYSHDKTGLEARMKWFNVTADETPCADWWKDASNRFYNYTMLGEWHQFIETKTTNVFSGSNNVLYRKDECNMAEDGYIDENCLYTFGDVKKALVDGNFIPLTPNNSDPAYHATANASQYYICFTGCNWHPATPYTGESKAYTIEPETGVQLHYIWFNNDWLNVEREEPFFFTADEQTNVRTYYEYLNGDWVVATPYVSVTDEAETRNFYSIHEAFRVASIKKGATIKLLRDLPNTASACVFETQNTTCTLDLNGHVLGGTVANLVTVNAPGCTFTITDNAALKIGKITTTQSKAVYAQKGTVVLSNGTLEATGAYAIECASTGSITINGGYLSAATQCVNVSGSCSISGGHFTDNTNLENYCAANKYPFETEDPKYKYEVSTGYTITFKDGGTTLQTLHVKDGETPVYTADQPTQAGNKFIGWDPAIVAATADATYTAQFEAIGENKSCVTLNSNGGNEGLQYVYVTSGSAIGTLPAGTTKDGHTFAGWFDAANGGTQITTATTVSADVTWYAHYNKNTYTLTWDANGGQLSGGTPGGSVEFGATITAPTATKDGHTFLGWNATPATTMPAQDVTYTAQWSIAVKHYLQNIDGTYPATPEATDDVDGEAGEYVTPKAKTFDGFITPKTQTVRIGETDEVRYEYTRRTYTITLDANGGTCATTSLNVKHGATLTLPVATKGGANCSGWFTKAIGGDQITNETKISYNIGTLYAQYADLNVTAPLTVSDDRSVSDLRVTTTGSLNVTTGSITANNFYLESNGSTASGQIVGGIASINAAHAYFDFKVNAKNHKWYGVAVPWQVDATSGISVNGKTLELGKDFDIVYYDGARRAAEGKKKCWKYVEKDGDKTLVPGRLYMIGLMMDAPTIRFEKESEANILTTSTSVAAHASAVATDANWNGVANPALFHAFVNAGALVGQVYNPETNSYDEIPMNTTKMVVGQGAFVQGPNTGKAITVTYGGAYAAAPRRARAEEAPLYDVRIAPAEAEYTDRLFVRVEDEKEADTYVIGKDLAKLGVSKSVAQMWINRYNTELCLNTMTMENGVAEYPLSIFAPKAGEYTISSQSSVFSDQYTLYLTFNGEAIWNLSDGAYTGTFDAGTTSAYGLRISARAPQITTGIDEAVVDAKGETRKVLIDNQVFIIRGEKVYSVDGQLVK